MSVFRSVGALSVMEGSFLDVAADVIGTGCGVRVACAEDDRHEGSVLLTPVQARAMAAALIEAAQIVERTERPMPPDPTTTAVHRWVEFALRYADGRIEPQPGIGLRGVQGFAKRHDLTVVSRVVTATEWEDANV